MKLEKVKVIIQVDNWVMPEDCIKLAEDFNGVRTIYLGLEKELIPLFKSKMKQCDHITISYLPSVLPSQVLEVQDWQIPIQNEPNPSVVDVQIMVYLPIE